MKEQAKYENQIYNKVNKRILYTNYQKTCRNIRVRSQSTQKTYFPIIQICGKVRINTRCEVYVKIVFTPTKVTKLFLNYLFHYLNH